MEIYVGKMVYKYCLKCFVLVVIIFALQYDYIVLPVKGYLLLPQCISYAEVILWHLSASYLSKSKEWITEFCRSVILGDLLNSYWNIVAYSYSRLYRYQDYSVYISP